MIDFRVSTNAPEISRWLRMVHADQLPFATSLAINNVTKEAQAFQRQHMLGTFQVRRRQWVERNVKIMRFSNKRQRPIHSLIGIEAPGDPSRSDILSKFEEGGVKRPKDGRRLAVPDEVKRTTGGVIRRGMRPKDFQFRVWGRGPKAEILVGERRTFMIRKADGTGGIYQRTGRKRAGRRLASDIRTRAVRDLNVRVLYRFTPEANIDSRLHFEENVDGVVRARFSRTFKEAFEKAIAAGRIERVGRHDGREIIQASREARRIARADVADIGRGPRR